MDYSLCDQTVTVYRNRGGEVTREVFQNAFLSIEEGVSYKDDAPVRSFLLVIPGAVFLMPGDRVLYGIGPMDIDWEGFIPANVQNLVEVGCIRHYRLNGEICHTEAENPWN